MSRIQNLRLTILDLAIFGLASYLCVNNGPHYAVLVCGIYWIYKMYIPDVFFRRIGSILLFFSLMPALFTGAVYWSLPLVISATMMMFFSLTDEMQTV